MLTPVGEEETAPWALWHLQDWHPANGSHSGATNPALLSLMVFYSKYHICPKKYISTLILCLKLTRVVICALAPNWPTKWSGFSAAGHDAIPGLSANQPPCSPPTAFTCLLTLGLDFLRLLSFAWGSGEPDGKSSLASSFLGAACSLLGVSPAETLPYREKQKPRICSVCPCFFNGGIKFCLHPYRTHGNLPMTNFRHRGHCLVLPTCTFPSQLIFGFYFIRYQTKYNLGSNCIWTSGTYHTQNTSVLEISGLLYFNNNKINKKNKNKNKTLHSLVELGPLTIHNGENTLKWKTCFWSLWEYL